MALPNVLLSALAGMLLMVGALMASDAAAQAVDPCAKADAVLATKGRGDPDQDGLSTCRERKITATSPTNDDSDNDGIEDGEEIDDSTDPLDDDSDDDGLSDGDEDLAETNPDDPDSDNDGTPDGADLDPDDELGDRIEGDATSIVCPSVGVDGSVTLLGNAIILNMSTEFEGAETCAAIEANILANGSAHLEAHVEAGLVASELELEDADSDDSPDEIDSDDDNDGIDDDDDDDDDGDGVDDDLDDDELDD